MASNRYPFSVLFASQYEEDFQQFRQCLHSEDLVISHARTAEEAVHNAHALANLAVVVADGDLPLGGWSSLLRKLEAIPNPPRLVVSSRTADNRLWADVLNLGGFDVLAKPFAQQEVAHVVAAARDSWAGSRKEDPQSALASAGVSSVA